jgi:cytoskeletal protein CcmA (bactofilin family)
MAMFRRESEGKSASPAPPGPAVAERRATPALIAPGCRVVGSIGGTADVQIDGELEGQVRLESAVTIGASGVVRGDIAARTVRIGGKVIGSVRGSERVEVLPSGQLEGDVAAPRVVISEGAFFKGKVEMTGQAKGESA